MVILLFVKNNVVVVQEAEIIVVPVLEELPDLGLPLVNVLAGIMKMDK